VGFRDFGFWILDFVFGNLKLNGTHLDSRFSFLDPEAVGASFMKTPGVLDLGICFWNLGSGM
jgi:hypothetical protein